MVDVIDLSTFRLRRQLRQSVATLGNSATGANGLGLPPQSQTQSTSLPKSLSQVNWITDRGNFGLPPVPHPGKSKGDFVRLRDGSVGWVSEHKFLGSGRLMLCVRIKGYAAWVMADDCDPVSAG